MKTVGIIAPDPGALAGAINNEIAKYGQNNMKLTNIHYSSHFDSVIHKSVFSALLTFEK